MSGVEHEHTALNCVNMAMNDGFAGATSHACSCSHTCPTTSRTLYVRGRTLNIRLSTVNMAMNDGFAGATYACSCSHTCYLLLHVHAHSRTTANRAVRVQFPSDMHPSKNWG